MLLFMTLLKTALIHFYLSHEIQLRKPNADIYEFVLKENNLKPEECLFIDDTKENTDTANKLGIHTWNIDETTEDIINLFSIKKRPILIYLIFSIIASTLIFIIFKSFDKFKINTLQAIVINYFVACIYGLLNYENEIKIQEVAQSEWFYGAIFWPFYLYLYLMSWH